MHELNPGYHKQNQANENEGKYQGKDIPQTIVFSVIYFIIVEKPIFTVPIVGEYSDNDKVILYRFTQGDENAFIEIYDRYWYRLFLSSYRRTKKKMASEELVQELFVKLWQKRETLAIGQLENYLFSSIRNATIDYLQKEMVADKYREYYKVYTSVKCNTTEEMVELDNLEEALEKGLQTLSGKSEKIFRLYKMEHWPVDKIAQHFDLSEKTVHYHLTRSLKFIRSYLQHFTLALLLFASWVKNFL